MERSLETFPDDFTIELDDAVRKSWSEPQEMTTQTVDIFSPVGTPPVRNESGSSSGSMGSSFNQSSLVTPPNGLNESFEDNGQRYRRRERHYSLTENTHESISDIMVDLDLGVGNVEEPQLEILPVPIRRGSVQDVQRVRQLLNPRSSFSGVSSDEPETSKQENTGWVTILVDDKPETIKPVIILHRSLLAVNSKYRLHVLHNKYTDAAELAACGIRTLCFDEPLPRLLQQAVDSSSILSLFVALVDKFELACYLSPTCMVMENVDELLESEEICNEIDNETCVLLTKEAPEKAGKNYIQIAISRPCNEVAMCIKELFTEYGDDQEVKKGKVCCKDDFDVLRTLFNETWGHLSSEEYCGTPFVRSATIGNYKIIDYKLLKPWNDPEDISDDSINERWHLAWQEFEHSSRKLNGL